eukprot:scaffold26533_cov42-Phaeocystis_antarctica.AAC.1
MAAPTAARAGSPTMAASRLLQSRHRRAPSGGARGGASLATAAASCTARRWRARRQCTHTRLAQARAMARRVARPIAMRAVTSAKAAGSARRTPSPSPNPTPSPKPGPSPHPSPSPHPIRSPHPHPNPTPNPKGGWQCTAGCDYVLCSACLDVHRSPAEAPVSE